jgi:hypothetical protein
MKDAIEQWGQAKKREEKVDKLKNCYYIKVSCLASIGANRHSLMHPGKREKDSDYTHNQK